MVRKSQRAVRTDAAGPVDSGLDISAPFLGNRGSEALALDRLALDALLRGEADRAFCYIDRRCRIAPSAGAYHHLLRAEALAQKNQTPAALKSIARALDLAPEDPQANRRMLAWGKSAAQLAVARRLCAQDDQPAVLLSAAKLLRQAGAGAIGSIRVLDQYVRGWVAWNGKAAPELVVSGEGFEESVRLDVSPETVFLASGFKKYATFRWDFADRRPAQVLLRHGDVIVARERVASARGAAPRVASVAPAITGRKAKPITVIVPVYRDLAATRDCLESLAREAERIPACRLVVVNDASPELKMAAYLKRFAAAHGATLMTNAFNLGFVGAVNHALETVAAGDIVLLNADTVLPGDALLRLQKAAASDPHIGTVTPLSNNGEFTSFPIAPAANPLPSREELAALDAAARHVNAKRLIDIPSGIGFCLFISETCFKAVGFLSDRFHGGYLEDVDFCLRARERGFRNVCDPSVFVAHAGSRSFLADKNNLVRRNLPIIDERFPNDQAETSAFLRVDPLMASRAAIERKLTAGAALDRLIVTGAGLSLAIAEDRARALSRQGLHVWLAVCAATALSFRNISGAMPQSLSFDLARKEQRSDCEVYLRGLRLERVEIADPASLPQPLAEMLRKRRVDLLLGDASWLGNAALRDVWLNGRGKAERIIALSKEAVAFAKASDVKVPIVAAAIHLPASRKRVDRPAAQTCGVVTYGCLSEDVVFLQQVAGELRRYEPRLMLVVLGATSNDQSLMACGNMFVSGKIEADEFGELCSLYGIDRLFAASRRPIFGLPLTREMQMSGLPLAFFDWSHGAVNAELRNLAFSPQSDASAIAQGLHAWMTSSP